MDITKFLVIDGGTVKTGAEGIVEGLGIVFGSEEQPDRSEERDFFTKDSKVRNKNSFEVPLYWEHGIKGYDEPIGEATLTKSTIGWHASAEIDLSTAEGKSFYDKVKNEQYGFSTGSMSHLVRRESKGNNTHFLKNWPVGEISLVKMPAESRALVQSIKSLQDIADAAEEEVIIPTEEVKRFPTEEEKATSVLVALYELDGDGVWEADSGEEMPEWAKDSKSVKSIEVKYAAGSVSYTLWTGEADSSIDITINDYSDPSDVLNAIQSVINKAATAVANAKSVKEPEEKEFNDRVAAIVKSMLNGTDEKIVELQKQLEDKENDLADLKSKYDSREEALTNAQERMAQLEILAGAKETINKYKGN